jgi:hypothetical protein
MPLIRTLGANFAEKHATMVEAGRVADPNDVGIFIAKLTPILAGKNGT